MVAQARGKLRASERASDEQLGQRQAEVISGRRKSAQASVDSHAPAGLLRSIVTESLIGAKCALWPGLRGSRFELDTAEESYILVLTMVVGSSDMYRRKGLRIREYEFNDLPNCGEGHS